MDEASGGVDTRHAETGSLLDVRQMAADDGKLRGQIQESALVK